MSLFVGWDDLKGQKKMKANFKRNVEGPRDYHIKWSKSGRGRQILYDITYMCNLKYDTNELIYIMEIDWHRDQTYCYQKGKLGGEG